MNETKLDRRRKYYLVLDCETATLPYASNYSGTAKKNIAIAKPLIYDLGWKIVDGKGNEYVRKSYLITEIFSVPAVFDTAYFKDKRPQYLEKLRKGEISLVSWAQATEELEKDLQAVVSCGAYNSMFDYKKAIPFTEKYIEMLYSPYYHEWERKQNEICDRIASGEKMENQQDFDPDNFVFRDNVYPLFCLWGLSCTYLLNNDDFREFAYENNLTSASGKFFSTTAENTYRYIHNTMDFTESHTAIEDADIETEIFALIMKKAKRIENGIIYFPFREVGKMEDYEVKRRIEKGWL